MKTGNIRVLDTLVVEGGNTYFGSSAGAPLFPATAGTVDKYFLQDGNLNIERTDGSTPQIKFKSDTTSNIGTIAFKDQGDKNQFCLTAMASDHPTEAREFTISQQYNGSTWYTPFRIKSQVNDDMFIINQSGLDIKKATGPSFYLKANNSTGNSGLMVFHDENDSQKWMFLARGSNHATEARQFRITEYNQGTTWYDPFRIMPATPTDAFILAGGGLSIGVPLIHSQTPQTLSGAGAVDVTSAITHIVTDSADALTLADGTEGQVKYIVMKTDLGAGTITPTNLGNGSTIVFDDVGDSAHLVFTNGAWHFMGGTATLNA